MPSAYVARSCLNRPELARELKPEDFAENVVIKLPDEVEVDVSTKAWTVTYADQNPRFPTKCDTIADLLPTDSP